ncbi:MAG: CBS domain-containing protein [Oligoflexia bacterium]|nr:CBS domain-containing protein [Oligoflexia bacterium]
MLLKEIMTKDVECLWPQATLKEAAKRMKEFKIGSIIITKEGNPIGIITDRDIVVRALAHGADVNSERVENIMSTPLAFCYEDQTMEEAAELMEAKGIRRLPILGRDRKLVGLVSISDVAVDGNNKKLTGRVLETISLASVLH